MRTKKQQKKRITTLKLLAQANPVLTLSQIAKERKTTYQNIYILFKKYQREQLITPERELTEKGKITTLNKTLNKPKYPPNLNLNKPLNQQQEEHPTLNQPRRTAVKTPEIRLHNVQFKIDILKKPNNWNKYRTQLTKIKKYNPTKWRTKKGALFQELIINNVRVRITSKSILILPQDIWAKTPHAAVNKAEEILYDTIPQVENLFNIKLEKERKLNISLTKQHHALVGHPIAKYCLERNIPVRIRDRETGELRVIVDNSKGLQELEPIHPKHAEEDANTLLEDMEDKIHNNFYPASLASKFIGQTADQVNLNARTIGSLLKLLEKQQRAINKSVEEELKQQKAVQKQTTLKDMEHIKGYR